MLVDGLDECSGREDLVLMRIENHMVHARLHIHEAVPVALEVQEGVVNADGSVSVAVADDAPAVVVERFDVGEVEGAAVGLVEQLDAGYDVGGRGVAFGKTTDGV